jgi:hypothetical protein
VRLDNGAVREIVLSKGVGCKGVAFRFDDGENSQHMAQKAEEDKKSTGLPPALGAPISAHTNRLNTGLQFAKDNLDTLILPFAIRVCIDVANASTPDAGGNPQKNTPDNIDGTKLVIAAELPDSLKVILGTANLEVLMAFAQAASKTTTETKTDATVPPSVGGQRRSQRPRASSISDQKRPRGSSIARRKSSILDQARRRASSILKFAPAEVEVEQAQPPNFRVTFSAPQLVVCVKAGKEDIATLEISGVHIFVSKLHELDLMEFGFVLQQLVVVDMLRDESQFRLLASSLQQSSVLAGQGAESSSSGPSRMSTGMESEKFQIWQQSLSADNLTSICATHQATKNSVFVTTFFNSLHFNWNAHTIARLIEIGNSLEAALSASSTGGAPTANAKAGLQYAPEREMHNSGGSVSSQAPPLKVDAKLFLNSLSISLNREWEEQSVCAISLAHFSIVAQVHAEEVSRLHSGAIAGSVCQPSQSTNVHGALLCAVPGFQRVFTHISIGNFGVEDTSGKSIHRQLLVGTRFQSGDASQMEVRGDSSSLFHVRFESPATALVQSKIKTAVQTERTSQSGELITSELDASLLALQIVVVHQQLLDLEYHVTQVCLPSLQGGNYDSVRGTWIVQNSTSKDASLPKPSQSGAPSPSRVTKDASWFHVHLRAEAAEIRIPAGPAATEGLHLQVGHIDSTVVIDTSKDHVHDISDVTMKLQVSGITLASRDADWVPSTAAVKTGGMQYMVDEPVEFRLQVQRQQYMQRDRDSTDADTTNLEAKVVQSRTHLLLTRAQFLLIFRVLNQNLINVEHRARVQQTPKDVSVRSKSVDKDTPAPRNTHATSDSKFELGAIGLDICGANR